MTKRENEDDEFGPVELGEADKIGPNMFTVNFKHRKEIKELKALLCECREWISGNYNTSITAREFDRAYDNFRKRLDKATGK